MRASEHEDYLKHGLIPTTLSHELRHAGFDRFELDTGAGGRNFYHYDFNAEKGALDTAGGYSKYVSGEEPYIHLRDLRSMPARTRSRIVKIMGEGTGGMDERIQSAVLLNLSRVHKKSRQAYSIARGVRSEIAAVLSPEAKQKIEILIPFFAGRITLTWTTANKIVTADMICTRCSRWFWGRERKLKAVLDDLRDQSDTNLGDMEGTLSEVEAILNELHTDAKAYGARISALELLERFDLAFAKVVKLIQREPKY